MTEYLELDCVKIFHEAKLQAVVQMQITRSQTKTFQNRRIFRERNKVTLAELPSKLTGQTLVFTCPLRVESLRTLFAVSVGVLQSQLALVTNKFYQRKVERGGASPVATGAFGGLGSQNNAPTTPN